MQNATLKNNTTVSIYWAHSLGVYGGINDIVEDNLLCDPANFPGMLVSVFNGAALQSGTVQGNVLVRGGGDCYNLNQAAIEIGNSGSHTAAVGGVTFQNNVIIDSMQKAVEFTNSSSTTFANNIIDGLWVNSASPSSLISAINIQSGQTGSATFTSNTLQDLLPGQVAWVNSSASGFQTSGTGNVGFDPTAAGPTTWTGSSDAGAARRTASCTTPVSLVLGDAGSPQGASDGGGASTGTSSGTGTTGTGSSGGGGTGTSGGGTGTSEDGGPAGTGGADAGAAKQGGGSESPGCGCAIPGPGSTGAWPGLVALLASLGYVARRGRTTARQPRRTRRLHTPLPRRVLRQGQSD